MSNQDGVQRRNLLWAVLGLSAGLGSHAQAQSAGQMLEELAKAAAAKRAGLPSALPSLDDDLLSASSGNESEAGIRAALLQGAAAAVGRLGKTDGFWGDTRVRIPLPEPLASLQKRLSPLRLSVPLDNFQLRLNRSAESMMPKAGSIFVDTIRSLTIEDVLQVLRGGDTAGTDLLKAKSYAGLVSLMTPPMAEAVQASGAGAALDRIQARYGSEIERLGGWDSLKNYSGAPITLPAPPPPEVPAPVAPAPKAAAVAAKAKVGATKSKAVTALPVPPPLPPPPPPVVLDNPLKNQLIGFAVDRTLDGLFIYIGEEERGIRRDPARRGTDLLKRVFGSL
jgi:hypothetical protein